MTDFMRWMYDHYIKPNIESQPITDGEFMQIDLLKNELTLDMQKPCRRSSLFTQS